MWERIAEFWQHVLDERQLTGPAFVTATEDCLVFWIIHYGASIATIADKASLIDNKKVFSRTIRRIDIWAESHKDPEWIWIQIATMRSIRPLLFYGPANSKLDSILF